MKKRVLTICILALCAALACCAQASPTQQAAAAADISDAEETVQNDLGAMSPEDALAYMQAAQDLVIVDVAATRWYAQKTFAGAVNIPIEELSAEEEDALYLALPQGRPVLLHCRLGMIVPGAYARVKALRPDIPEIGYIDGAPLFDEYNDWLSGAQ